MYENREDDGLRNKVHRLEDWSDDKQSEHFDDLAKAIILDDTVDDVYIFAKSLGLSKDLIDLCRISFNV